MTRISPISTDQTGVGSSLFRFGSAKIREDPRQVRFPICVHSRSFAANPLFPVRTPCLRVSVVSSCQLWRSELPEQLAVGRVPEADFAVAAAGGEGGAVRAESEGVDGVRAVLERLADVAALPVDQADGAVGAAAGEEGS